MLGVEVQNLSVDEFTERVPVQLYVLEVKLREKATWSDVGCRGTHID